MRFKDLKFNDFSVITDAYQSGRPKSEIQSELSETYGVDKRTIRHWANRIGLGHLKPVHTAKIMIYDIETSRAKADLWWSGKQYVHSRQIFEEPKIITISWKWVGSDTVYKLAWDMETHSDKELVRTFLGEYNKADMIIGQNNDNFDNRWINARAMKYNFDVNMHVKSYDLMKLSKRAFRLLGYSMDYMTKFADITNKSGHEGMVMWEMIERGTPEQQVEYIEKMMDYNVDDVIATEAMYLRFRKYFGHKTHIGVLEGGEAHSCPACGAEDAERERTTVTVAGTIQHIMKCSCESRYKLTNRKFLSFEEYKRKNEE